MNAWMERAKGGDPAATAALVERLRPRLEKMAAYYALRCGEDPEDLLQEAWLGLLEALPSLDMRIGSPEQYLIRRAKWRLLDWIKRARLRRCAALDGEAEILSTPHPAVSAVGWASVGEFLGQLSGTQRAIVECLLAGLTWREAGSALGCTSANVAYHVRQIRRLYEVWNSR
jgi:RNA polymerase sigma factor (sigma-70 family)